MTFGRKYSNVMIISTSTSTTHDDASITVLPLVVRLLPFVNLSIGELGASERRRMGHSNTWNSHPKLYGPSSRTCMGSCATENASTAMLRKLALSSIIDWLVVEQAEVAFCNP
ncbi:hypothetical protein L1887_38432 [Cichorium endivia]|nr:hypothetical protein L1887_38432 [Cichorium endivia]